MCANYRPSTREALAAFPLPPPDFAPRLWVPACFGLIPGWAKDTKITRSTYNARSETVGEKPSFRHAWKHRQLCIIPANSIFEPCYETGKAVRWRIEREDGKPMGLAGIWERSLKDDGRPSWSFSMLTINADNDPVFRRFHKPEDEKRSVVILPDDAWGDWLRCKSEGEAARSWLCLPRPSEKYFPLGSAQGFQPWPHPNLMPKCLHEQRNAFQ